MIKIPSLIDSFVYHEQYIRSLAKQEAEKLREKEKADA